MGQTLREVVRAALEAAQKQDSIEELEAMVMKAIEDKYVTPYAPTGQALGDTL